MSKACKPARLSVLSAAIAAAMYTTPVLSQDDMEDFDSLMVLEEVIVTAQKRQQTIQSVPSSIAAVTAETISRTNTSEFSDLGKITAGITVAGPGDGFGNVMRIRGIGNNPLSPFIRPSVGIFIDEVPIFDLAAAFSNLADVERIEILKGPQATLFGKEVSSGAISIFTKRPNAENFDGNLEATVATLGETGLRGGINIPITDSISFRGAAFTTDRTDYALKNVYDGKDVEFESDGFRGRLLWEVNDNFSALLSYQTHSSTQTGYEEDIQSYGNATTRLAQRRSASLAAAGISLLEADPFDRKIQTLGSPNRDTDFDLAILTLEYETDSDWTFTSISSYQVYENQANGDVDNIGDGGGDAHFSLFGSFVVQNEFHTEGLTQELRASFEGDYLSSIIGLFYARTDYDTDTAGNTIGAQDIPLDPNYDVSTFNPVDPSTWYTAANGFDPTLVGDLYIPVHSFSDEMSEEWAVFTHNTYDITDDIELTFGLRYSEVRKEKLGGNLTGVGPYADLGGIYVDAGTIYGFIPPATPLVANYPEAPLGQGFQIPGGLANFGGAYVATWYPKQQNDKWTATTGSLKIAYRINQDVKAYLGVDRGFKAGGFNADNGLPTMTAAGPFYSARAPQSSFDSEFATNVELGLKGTFLENTVRWNSAIYRQLFDDFQVEVQDDIGIGQSIVNAAKVEVLGAETEVTWLVNDRVLVDANVAYSDAHFKDFDNADCITPQYAAVACPNGPGTLDLSDKRVNGTGLWSANFSTSYTDELGGGSMSWYVRGELAFRDDRVDFPDLDPATKQPSYTLVNASVGLLSADESWETVLWVKNLTDEEYTIIHSRGRDGVDSLTFATGDFSNQKTEGIRVKLGNARQFGFTARYRF